MKLALAKFIAQKIEDLTGEEVDIRENYSGRGMYGENTAAIVTNRPLEIADTMVHAYLDAFPDEIDELQDAMNEEEGPDFDGFKSDSMGKGYIFY
jgi:hypothetical protein